MTTLLDLIKNRRSIGKLIDPIPTQAQIYQAIDVALTAPDHKKLQPYRFVVLENDGLNQLGETFVKASVAKGETDEKMLEKARYMPHRAKQIIVCITDFKDHPKVPEFEQLLSMGACVQNLLLALQAQGFATVWRSGDLMNTPEVKQLFNVDECNMITGFVYVGTAGVEAIEREPIDSTKFVQFMTN